MAAGIGSRLQQINGDRPKCLIEVDGVSLIGRSVTLLQSRGISDISVITGYKSDLLQNELRHRVKFIHNPDFDKTNSIVSLWLAKDLLFDDVILMNADLYYKESILDMAIAQRARAVMMSDCTRIEDADFRFGVEGSKIVRYGNALSNAETDCEYVGIVRIDECFISDFRESLETMVASSDVNNWWEGVLYAFIDDGITIYCKDVEGAYWSEVDSPQDYYRLISWISSRKSELTPTTFASNPLNGISEECAASELVNE